AEGPAFDTMVLCGPRTALPHGRPGARVLRRGDLVLVDFGATVGGYRSDVTRVWACGTASAGDRALYARVFAAYLRGRGAVRAGRTAGEPDAAARKALGGMVDRFIHSLGHGVGLA